MRTLHLVRLSQLPSTYKRLHTLRIEGKGEGLATRLDGMSDVADVSWIFKKDVSASQAAEINDRD